MHCPDCYSNEIVKNGFQSKNNKQKYLCKKCRRQFVLEPEKHKITDTQKEFIDKFIA
jgi:insertion element IS1 protein InsB